MRFLLFTLMVVVTSCLATSVEESAKERAMIEAAALAIKCDLCVNVLTYYKAKADKLDADCEKYKRGTSCNRNARVNDGAVRTLFDKMCGSRKNAMVLPPYVHGAGALTVEAPESGGYEVVWDPHAAEGKWTSSWATAAIKEACFTALHGKEWEMAGAIIRAVSKREGPDQFLETAMMACEDKVKACRTPTDHRYGGDL